MRKHQKGNLILFFFQARTNAKTGVQYRIKSTKNRLTLQVSSLSGGGVGGMTYLGRRFMERVRRLSTELLQGNQALVVRDRILV